jgi:hypothetical protein
MAILNFAGAASIWLQSVRNKVVLLGWDEFCTLLCTRFGRDHVCPPQVQLHVMEELWAALELNDTDEVLQPKAEQLCALSYQATFGTDSDTVMQLQAWIFGKQVLMLIDSGSTTSFIRDSFAAQFVGITPLPVPIRVRVADGAELH